jgi:hypothetical protein
MPRDISLQGQDSVLTTGILFQQDLETSFRYYFQTNPGVPTDSYSEAIDSPLLPEGKADSAGKSSHTSIQLRYLIFYLHAACIIYLHRFQAEQP